MSIKVHVHLDCTGLSCPMPIVKTNKAMEGVEEGQVLEVKATDRGSIADLKAWCDSVGHQYVGMKEEDGVLLVSRWITHWLR
mgnify:CR=1 FL=1